VTFAYVPTQAAEFSGPGKQAVVLYAPDWAEVVLAALRRRPPSYEAAWSFEQERRAHVLQVEYEGGPVLRIALLDGVHNAVFAKFAKGCAMAISPYPLYGDSPEDRPAQLFSPEESLILPELPNPLG
jgi:hypothetical protein